ncbi:site-specific integrase, partial [Candidatus Aerophobetes bacterium]|nr:site-specific integrase [Candidatus Aerophobetes bacterium]
MEQKEILKKFLNYLLTEKALSINTVKSYENDLKNFLKWLTEQNILVLNCKKDDIVQYLLNLKEKTYSSTSIARILSSLKQFFRFMIFDSIINHDPTEGLKSPKLWLRLPKALEIDEVKRLLSVMLESKYYLRDIAMLEL